MKLSSYFRRIHGTSASLFTILTLTLPAVGQTTNAPATGTAEKPAEPTAGEYRNWIEFGFGGNSVDGDRAQFQQRHWLPQGLWGGIEELHFEQDVGKRGLFKLDARALAEAQDYGVRLEISEPDLGFLRVDARKFRTWYDGTGGYFPRNGRSFSLYDENFALDRSETWVEGGLRVPDAPEITLRYGHITRNGLKDSTSWGDTTQTGPGLGANTTRNIVPTFLKIDEERNIFAADLVHTLGETKGGTLDLGVGVRYENSQIDNSRNIRRRPNEAASRYVTQTDKTSTDLFNVHAFSEARVSDTVRFTLGYAYTSLDTDLSGSRIYGTGYDPIYDPTFLGRQPRDEGFLNLAGGSCLSQHVINFNMMWSPTRHLSIVPGIRVEKQDLNSMAEFLETSFATGAGTPATSEDVAARSQRGFIEVAGSLEARYTGLTNWVLYVRGNWMQAEGDQREVESQLDAVPVVNDLLRDTRFSRLSQKYTVGANWYPCRSANLGFQYYHKERNEDYSHIEDSTPNRSGNRYPAFLLGNDFITDDLNVRLTWRPFNNLTLVSRYDLQWTTVQMQGDGLANIESAEMTSHILSQSISWTPLSRLYLQGSVNYVMDKTDSPASVALATPTVLDSRNNYWNVTGTVGYLLTDKTDVDVQYFWYRADNFVDNSAYSQPYGAGAEEHGISTGLVYRVSERLRLRLRYGFFRNRDETFGGLNSYKAHMVSTSLAYFF